MVNSMDCLLEALIFHCSGRKTSHPAFIRHLNHSWLKVYKWFLPETSVCLDAGYIGLYIYTSKKWEVRQDPPQTCPSFRFTYSSQCCSCSSLVWGRREMSSVSLYLPRKKLMEDVCVLGGRKEWKIPWGGVIFSSCTWKRQMQLLDKWNAWYFCNKESFTGTF